MYLAFVTLYLLVCFNYEKYQEFANTPIKKEYDPIHAKYKDLNNNDVDFNYCGLKTCLIKCCGADQYIDFNDDKCKPEQIFKDKSIELGLGVKFWDEVATYIRTRNEHLSKYFVFIQRYNVTEGNRIYTTDQTYILEWGEMYYYKENSSHVTEVWRYRYCADYRINLLSEDKKIKLVYDVGEVHENLPQHLELKNNDNFYYYILGGGFLLSLILTAVFSFGFWKLWRRYMPLLFAYFFFVILAYILKITYVMLLKLNAFYHPEDCRALSACLYNILLSSFCWTLIINYDLKTLSTAPASNKLELRMNLGNFFRYCSFGWGLPMLITLTAIAVDRLDLDLERPPFNSCFNNEKQTTLYLYVPVAIMIVMNTTMLLSDLYDLWLVRLKRGNIERTKQLCLRSITFGKIIDITLMFIAIQNLPDVPALLYNVIYTCFVVIFSLYIFVQVFTSVFVLILCESCIIGFTTKFQKLTEDDSCSVALKQNDTIAIISNNDLDKKNNLTFTSNMDLIKDKIINNNILQQYEKLLSNEDEDEYKNIPLADNQDVENNQIVTDNNVKKYGKGY